MGRLQQWVVNLAANSKSPMLPPNSITILIILWLVQMHSSQSNCYNLHKKETKPKEKVSIFYHYTQGSGCECTHKTKQKYLAEAIKMFLFSI